MSQLIVGLGEILWDVFPDGRMIPGGAPFNFAFHCQQLGHPARIVSVVGDDELGLSLRKAILACGMSDELIQTHPELPTGTVTVSLCDGNPTYHIADPAAWDALTVRPDLQAAVHDARAICYGTLARRSTQTRTTINQLIASATQAIRIFDVNLRSSLTVDLHSDIRAVMGMSDWIKVNEDEFESLTASSIANLTDCIPDVRSVGCDPSGTTDPRKVLIITRGSHGAIIYDSRNAYPIPAQPVDVVDTVGAGDAFTAALLCLRLEGQSWEVAGRFASLYAARVCEHPGATPIINRQEVERVAFA